MSFQIDHQKYSLTSFATLHLSKIGLGSTVCVDASILLSQQIFDRFVPFGTVDPQPLSPLPSFILMAQQPPLQLHLHLKLPFWHSSSYLFHLTCFLMLLIFFVSLLFLLSYHNGLFGMVLLLRRYSWRFLLVGE